MGRLISQTSHHHLHNDDIRSARTNVSRTKISLGLPDEEFTDIEKEHKNTGSDIQLIKLIRVETDKKMTTGKDTQELGKIRDNDVARSLVPDPWRRNAYRAVLTARWALS